MTVVVPRSAKLDSLPWCPWCGAAEPSSSIRLACRTDYPYAVPDAVISACSRCARRGPPRLDVERLLDLLVRVGIVVAVIVVVAFFVERRGGRLAAGAVAGALALLIVFAYGAALKVHWRYGRAFATLSPESITFVFPTRRAAKRFLELTNERPT